MRKIIAGLFISLDGVVESPDKWHFPYFNDEMGAAVGDSMSGCDAILLGRVTWQEFSAYWPEQPSDEPPADYLNNTPKYVASTTLDSVEQWQNSTLLRGDLAEQVTELKSRPGGNIGMTGSPTLVRWLLREGLLDELRLLVHPIAVGAGKRLFDDDKGDPIPLTLLNSATFSTGVLSLTYGPAQS